MIGRRIWFIPLTVLGLVLGASAAVGQDKTAPPAAKALSPKELAEVIDKHIDAKLAKAKAVAAAPASEAEFLRRVYLDLAGRIPKVADARAFHDSKIGDKRAKLIEELLDGPQYVDHFSNTWRSVMISTQATPQAS